MRREPMGNEVYEVLKEKILNNRLKPGERLIETKIAEELDVSRTPVREALKQLEREELVTYYPRRGSVVSEVSIRDGMDLYEIRESLEDLAMHYICAKTTSEELDELGEIIDKMDEEYENENFDGLATLLFYWMFNLLEYITNDHLKNFLSQVYQKIQRVEKLSLYNNKEITLSYEEIKLIYLAMKDKDLERCRNLSKRHVKNSKYRFIYNTRGSISQE